MKVKNKVNCNISRKVWQGTGEVNEILNSNVGDSTANNNNKNNY